MASTTTLVMATWTAKATASIHQVPITASTATARVAISTAAVNTKNMVRPSLLSGTGPLHDAGARAGEGYSINLPVPKGSDQDAWVSLLEHIVIPAAEEFHPDLVLISAGYDAHRDEQGGCELEASSFAEMARHVRALGERTGAPVGAVLEGGYALDALTASVSVTMEALASDQPPDSVAPDFLTSRRRPTSATTGACETSASS